jgi:hypothetical protein
VEAPKVAGTGISKTLIASGAALSAAVDVSEFMVVGIYVPAWTSASITFAACDTATGTFVPCYDASGTELTITVTTLTGQYVGIAATALMGVKFLKVRSGTVGTPVNQGADRTIDLILAPLA